MRISTKGRYALRVMIDLVKNGGNDYVKLRELSERQQISEKYLEGILGALVHGKMVLGARGKDGGYKLNCDPHECSVWQILSEVETSMVPVACLEKGEKPCDRVDSCVTFPVWKELQYIIQDYLDSVKLEQFVRNSPETSGIIPEGNSWNCGL